MSSKKTSSTKSAAPQYLTELTNYAAHRSPCCHLRRRNGVAKAVRRRLIKASGDISELGYEEEILTCKSFWKKAEAELFSVSDQSLKQDLVSMETILTEKLDRLKNRIATKVCCVVSKQATATSTT